MYNLSYIQMEKIRDFFKKFVEEENINSSLVLGIDSVGDVVEMDIESLLDNETLREALKHSKECCDEIIVELNDKIKSLNDEIIDLKYEIEDLRKSKDEVEKSLDKSENIVSEVKDYLENLIEEIKNYE